MATRATIALDRLSIDYDLKTYDEVEKTAHEVCEKLGLEPREVFKTLLCVCDGRQVLALVPADRELSGKRLAQAAGAKNAQMADPNDIQRITGYVRGSVSPLATRRRLRVFIDRSAEGLPRMAVSAGARGQELIVAPRDLCRAVGGTFAAVAAGEDL